METINLYKKSLKAIKLSSIDQNSSTDIIYVTKSLLEMGADPTRPDPTQPKQTFDPE